MPGRASPITIGKIKIGLADRNTRGEDERRLWSNLGTDTNSDPTGPGWYCEISTRCMALSHRCLWKTAIYSVSSVNWSGPLCEEPVSRQGSPLVPLRAYVAVAYGGPGAVQIT